jgi:hypothetical protein
MGVLTFTSTALSAGIDEIRVGADTSPSSSGVQALKRKMGRIRYKNVFLNLRIENCGF